MEPTHHDSTSEHMLKPRITVVTITRNDLQGLQSTVSSVLGQTYPEVEYLIRDGASTDGTVNYLSKLPAQVKWISEKDAGIADAFNKAQEQATGETIVFMNSGDVFASDDTLACVIQAIPETANLQDCVIYGDYFAVKEGEFVRINTDHLLLHQTNSINHQSAFSGRSIYSKFSYDERLVLGMDYDYWLRCLRHEIPFVKVQIPVAKFALLGRSSQLSNYLHNQLVRFFLRTINSGKTLDFSSSVEILKIVFHSATYVIPRALIPRRSRKRIQTLLAGKTKGL